MASKTEFLLYKNHIYRYQIDSDNLKFINSYLIKDRKDMENILNKIFMNRNILGNRTIKDMISEWVSHNRLYKLGILKQRTKTTDFEANQNIYLKMFYKILSI